jgi:hypothetical protein
VASDRPSHREADYKEEKDEQNPDAKTRSRYLKHLSKDLDCIKPET